MLIYTIEVAREDRGLIKVKAETAAEAHRLAEEQVKKGEIEWASKDNIITSITASKPDEE